MDAADVQKKTQMTAITCDSKPKRRRVRIEDPAFEAPDGGWGWMIILAAGCGNLCLFPVLQQFGLIFRDKFATLGITASETTTIINLNAAITSLMGLLNGAMFRKFSFRQISVTGVIMCTISLIILSRSNIFIEYICAFSVLYGIGLGVTTSANALALNTYFQKRRRIATGFSWAATALGPIFMPHLISWLLGMYGVEGTTLMFAGIASNAMVGAFLLQPVHWHTKFKDEVELDPVVTQPLIAVTTYSDTTSGYIGSQLQDTSRAPSLFSSTYMFYADEPEQPVYEIIDPSTPMLSTGNDGWFSSGKKSLASSKLSLTSIVASRSSNYFDIESKKNSTQNLSLSPKMSSNNLCDLRSRRNSITNTPVIAIKRKISRAAALKIDEPFAEECIHANTTQDTNEGDTKLIMDKNQNEEDPPSKGINYKNNVSLATNQRVVEQACDKLEKLIYDEKQNNTNMQATNISLFEADELTDEEIREKMSIWSKIVIFFDLDLLKDPVYVNIMIGITLAWFAELNFSILTPFVLGDFGFTRQETATFMSILGGVDITVRFCIPFLAGKIGWNNRTFFLIGIMTMSIGRILLIHTQSYAVSIPIAILIGLGKGLRTIFMALAIPSHVPLVRLPAATGLQLLTGGLFSLACGPVIGWIRDTTNSYVLTLYCLNIMSFTTTITWIIERIIIKRLKQQQMETTERADIDDRS